MEADPAMSHMVRVRETWWGVGEDGTAVVEEGEERRVMRIHMDVATIIDAIAVSSVRIASRDRDESVHTHPHPQE